MQAAFEKRLSRTKTVFVAALVAGTLDILAAILVYDVIMHRVSAIQLLRGIAAGIFGDITFGRKMVMAATGLGLHYFIAFSFATAYFFIYPRISFLKKNVMISGLLYGIFVWLVMNLIVVPLSNAYHGAFTFAGVLRGVVILMICIGLPVSIIISRYYKKLTLFGDPDE